MCVKVCQEIEAFNTAKFISPSTTHFQSSSYRNAHHDGQQLPQCTEAIRYGKHVTADHAIRFDFTLFTFMCSFSLPFYFHGINTRLTDKLVLTTQ